MTSNRKTTFMEPFFDSDDSDFEYTHGKSIEDLKYEIDVAKFYRAVLRENLIGRNSETSRKPKKITKAVQTEPDTSGISPSWLNFSRELVGEIYTGLANMINTLYHTPNGYCKEDAAKSMLDPPDMKFFKYESGYWQSKLLPQVKIPATVGLNRQIHSESFKSELYRLLEKATTLQNNFPYEVEEGEDKVNCHIETETETNANKNSLIRGGEVTGKNVVPGPSCKELCGSQVDDSSCTNFSEESNTDSSVSRPMMRSRANPSKPTAYNTQKQSNHVVPSRSNVKSHELKSTSRFVASKPRGGAPPSLSHQASKCVEVSVPKLHGMKKLFSQSVDAADGIRNNRNGLIIIGGTVTKTSKPVTASGALSHCASKNFIKRNILASKFPAQRGATTSKINTG